MNILLLNFTIYLIWFLIAYKKSRITIHSFILLFYTVVAFLGYYTVSNGIYFEVFGKYSIKGLVFEPYFYCFITYVILFWPLKNMKFDFSNINYNFFKKVSLFIRIWIVYFILFTFLRLFEAVASIASGLGNVYEARHMEGQSLFVYDNVLLEKFNGYGFFLLDATVPFIMSYVFVGINKKYITYKYATFLIFLCFLPSVLSGIAMGSRGSLFMTAFSFMFFVILFWKLIPKSFLSKTYLYIGVFVSLIIFYSWSITSDRVGKGNEGFNSIVRYFGESFPNLGFLFWNKVINHPMGSRLFPNIFFKHETSFYSSVDESYLYWADKTGVPVLNFKTYFGDLYIEFGLLYAILFVMICSYLFKKYFKTKKLNIFSLSFLYYYFQLCIFAFAGFTKGGHVASFQLIITFIVYIILKFCYGKSLTNTVKFSA